MTYFTIDSPVPLDESDYREVLQSAIRKLSALDGIEAVYQIGGITSPGISDLDLVVVFNNEIKCLYNIHKHLNSKEKYLFIHKLFGCSESYFRRSSRFSFFHNFTLLAGEDIFRNTNGEMESEKIIRIQVALEYMLKLYVNIIVQKQYGILQIRGLLLHVKALKYDLDYLDIKDSAFTKMVDELLSIRNAWFSMHDGTARLRNWFERFSSVYPVELEKCLRQYGLFLDADFPVQIARNISLNKADRLSCKHTGMLLPSFPAFLFGKKYFRLNNRYNQFEVQIPINETEIHSALSDYFAFQKDHREYNQKYLPHFYPLTSSLIS